MEQLPFALDQGLQLGEQLAVCRLRRTPTEPKTYRFEGLIALLGGRAATDGVADTVLAPVRSSRMYALCCVAVRLDTGAAGGAALAAAVTGNAAAAAAATIGTAALAGAARACDVPKGNSMGSGVSHPYR